MKRGVARGQEENYQWHKGYKLGGWPTRGEWHQEDEGGGGGSKRTGGTIAMA